VTGKSEVGSGWRSIKLWQLFIKSNINFPTYYGNFHSCTMHLDVIKVFYLPTEATTTMYFN